jgi:CRISPR-associated protein Cmr6
VIGTLPVHLSAITPNRRRVEEFNAQARQRMEQLRGRKEKPNTSIHTLAQQLVKSALANPDWSAQEKLALAEAIETWLPQLVDRLERKKDWKEARKMLKLDVLKGQA